MRLVFLLTSVTAAMAGDTDNQGFAGSFSHGNGQGFGYGGSFGSGSSGTPQSGFGSGGSFPPGAPPFDFNNLLIHYFEIFKKFNEELATTRISAFAFSITNAGSNSKVQAKSSFTFDKKGLQKQQNAFAAGGYVYPGGYPTYANGGGFSSSGGQGAAASASIGPGGAHQTASVYPQNPNIPNVNTRFGASPGGSSYGVFTSSQSVSSNVNGKPISYHQASTTINDNGNVTTYTVHNP